MAAITENPGNVCGATLSRRQFVKTGGALFVGVTLVGSELLKTSPARAAAFKNSLDPTLPNSWIEIHPDSTILIRTGKSDFGQSTVTTAYKQIVAEEHTASLAARW
jgi:CO/xanthine dehydrogenase Mo-binding subunit